MTVENKILHHQLLQVFWVNNVKKSSWKQQILQSVDQKHMKIKKYVSMLIKSLTSKKVSKFYISSHFSYLDDELDSTDFKRIPHL